MSDWPKTPSTEEKVPTQPLVSGDVLDVVQPGRGDLSDWVELMEAVEALCPVWPTEQRREEGRYRL
jgi:hypothetical protein